MSVFVYKAIDVNDVIVSGTLAADSPRKARDELRMRGLNVQEMYDQPVAIASNWMPWKRAGRYAHEVGMLARELAMLVGVGIPVTAALDTLARQRSGQFRTSLLRLRDRVTAGHGLAEAMAEQPQVFDLLCVQMVEVGESSGTLPSVLHQIADFHDHYDQLKDRVVTALLYPVFVLVLSVGISIFLMSIVVPMLLENLLEAGHRLPWPTQVLKSCSDAMTTHGSSLLIAFALSSLAVLAILRTPQGQAWKNRLLLRMPLVGMMIRKQAVARMALIVTTLLKSGINLLTAFEVASRSTSNGVIRHALDQVRAAVTTGRDIGAAMEKTDVFPPMVIQIFAVGQQTGNLEAMLLQLAEDYDRQVKSLSNRLAVILEPVLILFLAVVVGFILFATILPILEAGNVL